MFGTRPEAVKLCPLVHELKRFPELEPVVCVTAQHREMLDQVLRTFDLHPDIDLNLMRHGQSLSALTARLMGAIEPVLADASPGLVVVQGDTSTTFCAALSAFYAGVPVAHVEAGLRTYDLQTPFPEEMNRRFTSSLAALHFAPTASAAENLKREGIPESRIEISGNTAVDAVLEVSARLQRGKLAGARLSRKPGKLLLLVTAHRRENLGAGLGSIARAAAMLAQRPDVQVVWPLHPNPAVSDKVRIELAGSEVELLPDVDYASFVDLMRQAYLILTDSGGVQEEAPSLGTPVLVFRDKTERPEAVEAGIAMLVGVETQRIIESAQRLLDDADEYARAAQVRHLFGDGKASLRIAHRIASFLKSSTMKGC